jgi:hypothetical protein
MDLASLFTAITNIDKLGLLLLVGVLAFIWSIWRAHKGNNLFDIKDFLMDPNTNRASINKLGQLIAMLVTSFGFIYLILHNGLSEMYFGLYAGLLGGGLNSLNKGIDTFSNKSDNSSSQNIKGQ